MRSPVYLKPATTLAERVLLPDDPHRALAIAQALLDAPLMFNHHYGLWGYTGTAADGAPLTVQATGIGGPSAAIVVSELGELGARVLIRIGRCFSLVDELPIGSDLVAASVVGDRGAPITADSELNERLLRAGAGRIATIVSTSLFYEARAEVLDGWRMEDAVAVDLESEAVIRSAKAANAACACLVKVTGPFPIPSGAPRVGADELDARAIAQARIAIEALGQP